MLPRTERLVLREMGPDDLPVVTSMLTDPVAMVSYNGPFTSREVQDWLSRQLERYHSDGYGLWAVDLGATGQMIGQCGITWQDINGVRCPEVGYHIVREFWHQGFAAEAALACRDYAFTELGMGEVFAQVRDINIASMNVAIRIGMTIRTRFIKQYRGSDMAHYAFSIRASEVV